MTMAELCTTFSSEIVCSMIEPHDVNVSFAQVLLTSKERVCPVVNEVAVRNCGSRAGSTEGYCASNYSRQQQYWSAMLLS